MTQLHSYSTIFAIGHRACQPLLEVSCLVEEKVDGSQFSFCFQADGSTLMRSKGAIVHAGEGGMFEEASHIEADWRQDLVGYVFRCEYLRKPHHNVLIYGRVPAAHLAVFDVEAPDGTFLDWDNKREAAAMLGLEVVPRLFEGMVTLDVMQRLLDTESFLGATKIEGVVIKPIGYNLWGTDKKVLMGKYVSEGFKEKHAKEWKGEHKPDILGQLVATYRCEQRWQKAAQHLLEAGRLEGSPRDIGALLKEVIADIEKEETEEIKAKLFQWAWPQIRKQLTHGLPEWWKEKLLKEAFDVAGGSAEGADN